MFLPEEDEQDGTDNEQDDDTEPGRDPLAATWDAKRHCRMACKIELIQKGAHKIGLKFIFKDKNKDKISSKTAIYSLNELHVAERER